MGSSESSRIPIQRRIVLRGLGAGVLAVTGAGTVGPVAAQSDDTDVTVLDLRESADPALPVVDDLLVFAHGWFGSSVGPDQAADLAAVLADGGYEPDEVVAFVYQADASSPEAAFEQATDAAAELAPLVQTAADEGVGSIRLAGHSLGGRVVLETLAGLEEGYVVDTVAPMGAAAVSSTVTEGGRWYDGIAEQAREVRNYHSQNYDVIQGDFGPESDFGSLGNTALGAQGAPDSSATPSTYTDVDVTDSVDGHGGYTSSQGLGQDLAEAITQQDDGDDGPPPLGDNTNAPVDSDGDGRYEDIDGDGQVTHDDVTTFFEHLEGDTVQNNTDAFDFDENGRIGFGDVIELLRDI